MRIEQLTFTRFLAAVSIVIFHYGGKSFIFNNESINFIFHNADVCVSYFFILSGFVMMLAYGNKQVISVADYFRNRFARIYPLYFLTILLMFLLQLRSKNVDLLGLFLEVFMIQTWIPYQNSFLNPPGWSLSVEFVFYAIFPFVLNNLFKKMTFKRICLYIILFWILNQAIQLFFSFYGNNELVSINGNPLLHLNEFLIGNLAGFYYIKNLSQKKGNYDLVILMLAGLVILALKFSLGINFHNGLLAVLFVPLIILFSLNNGYITMLFNKKPFVFLGEISFGIYILQHPVYSIISAYSINKYFHINDVTVVFFMRLVLLIIVSSMAYIYIEKPLHDRIRTRRKITSMIVPV